MVATRPGGERARGPHHLMVLAAQFPEGCRDPFGLEDDTLAHFDRRSAVIDADNDEGHPGSGRDDREILGERTPQHKLRGASAIVTDPCLSVLPAPRIVARLFSR